MEVASNCAYKPSDCFAKLIYQLNILITHPSFLLMSFVSPDKKKKKSTSFNVNARWVQGSPLMFTAWATRPLNIKVCGSGLSAPSQRQRQEKGSGFRVQNRYCHAAALQNVKSLIKSAPHGGEIPALLSAGSKLPASRSDLDTSIQTWVISLLFSVPTAFCHHRSPWRGRGGALTWKPPPFFFINPGKRLQAT